MGRRLGFRLSALAATALAVVVVGLAGPAAGTASLPAPGAPLPRDPDALARRLLRTTDAAFAAVDRWRADGDPSRGGPPRDVELLALHQQRILRLLRHDDRLWQHVEPRLASRIAAAVRTIVAAGRGLRSVTPALKAAQIRTKPSLPVDVLRRAYEAAERRFGVPWQALAAVNFAETGFGNIRTDSAVGAQGPMQFMPATWRAYGLGGDVHDDHDAILGAANYLRASGAPGDMSTAFYRYNPVRAYVDALTGYTSLIRDDERWLYVFYGWQLFVRTENGDVRLTGPGR